MKKLISCLLAVMMLFTAVSAFADSIHRVKKSNVLTKFLDETDLNAKDLALQVQSGDEISDLVIRLDGDNLHLATRSNGVVDTHIQLNSTGFYLGSGDSVTLLRYATVSTVLQDAIKALDAVLEEAIDSIPEQQVLSEAEVKEAVDQLGESHQDQNYLKFCDFFEPVWAKMDIFKQEVEEFKNYLDIEKKRLEDYFVAGNQSII